MKLGQQIKKIRLEKGLSQKALGAKAGMSQQQIAQYENGERLPKLTSMVKIATALEIDGRILTTLYQEDIGEIHELSHGFEIQQDRAIRPDEIDLITSYRSLNDDGKKEARKRVSELSEIERYKDIEFTDFLTSRKKSQAPD